MDPLAWRPAPHAPGGAPPSPPPPPSHRDMVDMANSLNRTDHKLYGRSGMLFWAGYKPVDGETAVERLQSGEIVLSKHRTFGLPVRTAADLAMANVLLVSAPATAPPLALALISLSQAGYRMEARIPEEYRFQELYSDRAEVGPYGAWLSLTGGLAAPALTANNYRHSAEFKTAEDVMRFNFFRNNGSAEGLEEPELAVLLRDLRGSTHETGDPIDRYRRLLLKPPHERTVSFDLGSDVQLTIGRSEAADTKALQERIANSNDLVRRLGSNGRTLARTLVAQEPITADHLEAANHLRIHVDEASLADTFAAVHRLRLPGETLKDAAEALVSVHRHTGYKTDLAIDALTFLRTQKLDGPADDDTKAERYLQLVTDFGSHKTALQAWRPLQAGQPGDGWVQRKADAARLKSRSSTWDEAILGYAQAAPHGEAAIVLAASLHQRWDAPTARRLFEQAWNDVPESGRTTFCEYAEVAGPLHGPRAWHMVADRPDRHQRMRALLQAGGKAPEALLDHLQRHPEQWDDARCLSLLEAAGSPQDIPLVTRALEQSHFLPEAARSELFTRLAALHQRDLPKAVADLQFLERFSPSRDDDPAVAEQFTHFLEATHSKSDMARQAMEIARDFNAPRRADYLSLLRVCDDDASVAWAWLMKSSETGHPAGVVAQTLSLLSSQGLSRDVVATWLQSPRFPVLAAALPKVLETVKADERQDWLAKHLSSVEQADRFSQVVEWAGDATRAAYFWPEIAALSQGHAWDEVHSGLVAMPKLDASPMLSLLQDAQTIPVPRHRLLPALGQLRTAVADAGGLYKKLHGWMEKTAWSGQPTLDRMDRWVAAIMKAAPIKEKTYILNELEIPVGRETLAEREAIFFRAIGHGQRGLEEPATLYKTAATHLLPGETFTEGFDNLDVLNRSMRNAPAACEAFQLIQAQRQEGLHGELSMEQVVQQFLKAWVLSRQIGPAMESLRRRRSDSKVEQQEAEVMVGPIRLPRLGT